MLQETAVSSWKAGAFTNDEFYPSLGDNLVVFLWFFWFMSNYYLQVNIAFLQNCDCSLDWCNATPLTGISPHQPLESGNPRQPGSTPHSLLCFINSSPSSLITFQFSLILSKEALNPVSLSVQTGFALRPSIALIGLWYLNENYVENVRYNFSGIV